MGEHKFSGGRIEQIDERILYIRFEKKDISIKDLQDITRVRRKLIGERPYGSIVDIRGNVEMSDEAKSFVAQNPEINKYRVVESIVVKNFVQKLAINSYKKLFKPKAVSRAFLDVLTAKDWILLQLYEFDSEKNIKD